MISVRVSHSSVTSVAELAQQWAQPDLWVPAVRGIIAGRMNWLISGATGSGKTSLLAGMVGECRAQERIVVVEDTTELHPDHPHVLHLQGRQGNVEGAGRVDMGRLVRETLRMRPDRLMVGECRGAELRDFLTAMNTGHQGAGGTVHANSPESVPARLVAMGALAGMSPETVSLQAAAALDVVLHVDRRAGDRMPVSLSAVSYDQGRLVMEPVLVEDRGRTRRGAGWAAFASRAGLDMDSAEADSAEVDAADADPVECGDSATFGEPAEAGGSDELAPA